MDEWTIDTPTISVLVEETKQSLVLDQTGKPFYLGKRTKVGFDLTPRIKDNAPNRNL